MSGRPSPIAAFLRELWRLLSTLSAGVIWGGLGVVLFAWLGEIADYGSPRLEALFGPAYEPVMMLAYPVLLASVPALAFLGVWVATGFGARRRSWNRSTTAALVTIAIPCAIAAALLAAAYIPAAIYPAITLLALGAAFSAASFVAAALAVPGVLVSAIALWRWRWWAAPGVGCRLGCDALACVVPRRLHMAAHPACAPCVERRRHGRCARRFAIEQAHRADAASAILMQAPERRSCATRSTE